MEPREEWGRWLLSSVLHASIFRRASPSDTNTCELKHSSLNRALNDSMKALSTGLPGRMKSKRTWRAYAHASSAFDWNSLPLSTWMTRGYPWCRAARSNATITLAPFNA